ncbi:hypothetical protein [Nocardia mikamii]|uniref:hypothetical protein n=1 Tax=Nocardia mikamii TaxID=508464 RepID=UPI000B020156|nr:hypothetical protein [Nocardia mikamii]
MSDQEVPGSRSAPKNTGAGAPKVVQLPRRPRRVADDAAEPPRKTWRSEGGRGPDPAPTRPVMRAELQRETGSWPMDSGAAWHGPAVADKGPATDDASPADQDASVVDLDELRRKRAGETAPAAGIRRIAKPRRIGKGANDRSGVDGDNRDGAQDSPSTDEYTGRHRR